METTKETLLRMCLGVFVMLSFLGMALLHAEWRAKERNEKFHACLRSGKLPMACSFEVAFN